MAIVRDGVFERFPWTITVASFLSSLLWAQYSAIVHDRLYLVPNLLGVLVCGAELIVAAWAVQSQSGRYRLGGDNQPLMPRRRSKTSMSNCYGNAEVFQGRSHVQLSKSDVMRVIGDASCVRKLESLAGSRNAAKEVAHEPPKDMALLSYMDLHNKSPFGAREVPQSQEHDDGEATGARSHECAAASYQKIAGAGQTQGKPGDIVCIL